MPVAAVATMMTMTKMATMMQTNKTMTVRGRMAAVVTAGNG